MPVGDDPAAADAPAVDVQYAADPEVDHTLVGLDVVEPADVAAGPARGERHPVTGREQPLHLDAGRRDHHRAAVVEHHAVRHGLREPGQRDLLGPGVDRLGRGGPRRRGGGRDDVGGSRGQLPAAPEVVLLRPVLGQQAVLDAEERDAAPGRRPPLVLDGTTVLGEDQGQLLAVGDQLVDGEPEAGEAVQLTGRRTGVVLETGHVDVADVDAVVGRHDRGRHAGVGQVQPVDREPAGQLEDGVQCRGHTRWAPSSCQ